MGKKCVCGCVCTADGLLFVSWGLTPELNNELETRKRVNGESEGGMCSSVTIKTMSYLPRQLRLHSAFTLVTISAEGGVVI